MTMVLGFPAPDDYDHALGAGGTLRLFALVASYLPWQTLRLKDGHRFIEVRADGSVVDKVFTEAEDPEDDFVPTVQTLAYAGWPSDSAPSMLPEVILPCSDGDVDMAGLRNEALVQAAGWRSIGNLDDAQASLFGEEGVSEDISAQARNLLECAGALTLLMVYR